MRYENQIDKLVLTFECWHNESSSVETSERVSDFQKVNIENGKYRGGGEKTVPFGYNLEMYSDVNLKGKPIAKMGINPEQAEVVKLIYELSIDYNFGARKIAQYLNKKGYKTKSGKYWTHSTINHIFNNPIYKGYMHMYSKKHGGTIYSPRMEDLIIIPEDKWERNQKTLKQRKQNNKGTHRSGSTESRVLLSGLVYCGHCGSKMNVWANHKHYYRTGGEKVKIVADYYKCGSRNTYSGVECDGQATYSANRIDPLVEIDTKNFIADLANNHLKNNFFDIFSEKEKYLANEKIKSELLLVASQEELAHLKKEIAKSLIGKSTFSSDLLAEAIRYKREEIESLLKKVEGIEQEIKQTRVEKDEYRSIDMNLDTWISRYDNATIEIKKVLLNNIIERVNLYKDNIEIEYKVSIITFKANSEENIGN